MKYALPIIAALFLLATIAGYGILFSRIHDGIARIEVARERAASLSRRDAIARSQEIFLSGTKAEQEALATLIVGNDNVVSAIELVEDTARREKVSLAISSVETADTGYEFHEVVIVEATAVGSFSALTQFIARLESAPVASRLGRVSFEAAETGWFAAFSVEFVKAR